ncbi:hypothetical protein GCM10007989_05860 [Devosia pacifica]|uniref:Uncharacterized protein n=1 Tax=Devosia pacifica TaxID=1335967 RepID=A0A918RYF9_9HYPH|nr:hypothetical protein [Devosia pacifica]GHA14034.1 hypothetical protein GCM10007989_05860 [Devosia pacifica]
MNASTAASTAKPETGSVGFNLAGMAVLAAMMAIGVAYAIDGYSAGQQRDGHSDIALERTIGGRELTIPGSWFRTGGTMASGFSSQIDLIVPLGDGRSVDVTLLPQSRMRASSVLLDTVYLHQFQPEVVSGIPGLVGKPLDRQSGFADETVWYDPLSPAPFAAKCLAPIAPEPDGRCLRSVVLPSGIGAVYSFDAALLAQWREFDAIMQTPLDAIGAWRAE